MKKITLILIAFFISKTYCQTIISNSTTGKKNYSGIYEAVIKERPSGGLSQFSNRNHLTRLHIYRSTIPNIYYQEMYNRETRETLKPYMIIGLIEVFDNKKGKGVSDKLFFTSVSYSSSNELEFGKSSSNVVAYTNNSFTNKNSDFLKYLKIPNVSTSSEMDISIGYRKNGSFRFIKEYDKFPEIFNPYINYALNEILKKNKNNLILGKKGYTSDGVVYTSDFNYIDSNMDVIFSYNNSSNYGINNPSVDWFNQIKYELINCLEHKTFGFHTILHYFPNLTELKVSLPKTSNSNSMHLFNVTLNKSNGTLKYSINNTPEANLLLDKAKLADIDREIAFEEERLKELKRQEEKKKKDAEAKKIEIRRIYNLMNETTATGEPTAEQMKFAIEYQYKVKKGRYDNAANANLDNSNNPIDHFAKLQGLMMQGIDVDIVSFQKLGCEKSNKPGFSCDYSIQIKVTGEYSSLYGNILNSGSNKIVNARFLKADDGIWYMVE